MKDLDFDELDRAVNSLMSGVSSDTANASETTQPARELNATQKPTEVSTPAQPSVAPVTLSKPQPMRAPRAQPAPPSLSPPERTGRFMDMVHESSDMRAARPLTPPSARASRYATVSTAPSSPQMPQTPQAPSVTPDEPRSVASIAGTMTPSNFDLVDDPVELEPVSSVEPVEPTPTSPSIEQVEYTERAEHTPNDNLDAFQSPHVQTTNEPRPYSPFVPDAKVEKRPLGLASSGASDEMPTKKAVEPEYESQVSAQPSDQLPAELQGDLIAIESEHAVAEEEPASTAPAPDTPAQKPAQPAANSKDSFDPRPKIASIPQQYVAEKKRSDETADGDVFGADTFAQPLAHPAKRKSGWLTVSLIMALILLGIGGGVLVYLFVL